VPLLDRLLVLAHSISRAAIWSGGTLVLCAAILVAVDVLLRNVFMFTFGGADELAGYAFAIGTTWALSFTLLNRANVRVDALYAVLPPRLCAVLDIVALIALGLFAGLLTWHAGVMLATSVSFAARATTPLQTPLWIPQSLWFAGLALFVLTLIPLLARAVLALLAGDLAGVRRLAGARSIEENAADEIAHTAALKPLE
jgi:TRAP-type C4-dicarboxylate transport system permease small subunit